MPGVSDCILWTCETHFKQQEGERGRQSGVYILWAEIVHHIHANRFEMCLLTMDNKSKLDFTKPCLRALIFSHCQLLHNSVVDNNIYMRPFCYTRKKLHEIWDKNTSTDRGFVHKSSWKFFLSRYYNAICSCNSSCTWSWLNARSCCSNLVPKLLLMFPLNPQWTAMSGAEFMSSINMLMTEDLLWTFAQLTVYP